MKEGDEGRRVTDGQSREGRWEEQREGWREGKMGDR